MNEFMDKFIEAISDYSAENRIAQALAIRGLKQVDLCEKTGLKKASVSGSMSLS